MQISANNANTVDFIMQAQLILLKGFDASAVRFVNDYIC